jgi:hypothetical protein
MFASLIVHPFIGGYNFCMINSTGCTVAYCPVLTRILYQSPRMLLCIINFINPGQIDSMTICPGWHNYLGPKNRPETSRAYHATQVVGLREQSLPCMLLHESWQFDFQDCSPGAPRPPHPLNNTHGCDLHILPLITKSPPGGYPLEVRPIALHPAHSGDEPIRDYGCVFGQDINKFCRGGPRRVSSQQQVGSHHAGAGHVDRHMGPLHLLGEGVLHATLCQWSAFLEMCLVY